MVLNQVSAGRVCKILNSDPADGKVAEAPEPKGKTRRIKLDLQPNSKSLRGPQKILNDAYKNKKNADLFNNFRL